MTKEDHVISFYPVTGAILDDFLSDIESSSIRRPRICPAKSPYEDSGIVHIYNAYIGNIAPQPLLSILRIARKRYSCFALVETPYFDLEDWDGYAVFYSRSFTSFSRICSRVHLFEGNEKCIPQLIKRLQLGIHQDTSSQWLHCLELEYRGFFVLRPYNSCVIGRTVIKFDERTCEEAPHVERHPLEETGQPYCTGSITNEFHLSSLVMTLDTAPAVQQNPVVGVCATASIWVASQILSERFGLHKYPYNTITSQALKHDYDDGININDWKLGTGLTLKEIKQALISTGCIPFICGPSDSTRCSSQARMRFLLYTFIESGLPVVAGYYGPSGHAVTIVGHLLPGKTDATDAAEAEAELIFNDDMIAKGRHLLLGQAIQLYYAHNDAYGPFDRLRILKESEAAKAQSSASPDFPMHKRGSCFIATWRREKDNSKPRNEQISFLLGFVVPLPPYVQNNRPEYVVRDAIEIFDNQFPQNPEESDQDKAKILWRCFLASAPDFKQSVIRRGYSPEMCRRYMEMHLPLFIWVVEFSILPSGSDVPYKAPRFISGEFIYDSTTPFYEPKCIAFRINKFIRDFRVDQDLNPCGNEKNVKCFIPVKTRR